MGYMHVTDRRSRLVGVGLGGRFGGCFSGLLLRSAELTAGCVYIRTELPAYRSIYSKPFKFFLKSKGFFFSQFPHPYAVVKKGGFAGAKYRFFFFLAFLDVSLLLSNAL